PKDMFTTRPSVCLAFFLLALAGLFGCQKTKPAASSPPPPKVTAARPVSYPVRSYYLYNGYLDAVEMVEIRARVKGFLTEIQFTEGTEVKQGDPLYTIEPAEYKAAVARSEADRAKAE